MPSATPHRIDPPSTSAPHVVGGSFDEPQRCRATADPSGQEPVSAAHRIDPPHPDKQTQSVTAILPTPDQWLDLHAGELVERLQSWASDLDSREAQLNARSSLQDHRERQFRLQQQDTATELAERQRAIERLRGEIEAQARRLAFRDDSTSD